MFVNGIHLQEYAKLEYGRLLWGVPAYRERLLRHWRDPRHPHAERFAQHETDVRAVLESAKGTDNELDAELRQRNLSLRVGCQRNPFCIRLVFLTHESMRLLNRIEPVRCEAVITRFVFG